MSCGSRPLRLEVVETFNTRLRLFVFPGAGDSVASWVQFVNQAAPALRPCVARARAWALAAKPFVRCPLGLMSPSTSARDTASAPWNPSQRLWSMMQRRHETPALSHFEVLGSWRSCSESHVAVQEAFRVLEAVLAAHAKARRNPACFPALDLFEAAWCQGGSFEGAPFALAAHSMGCQVMIEARGPQMPECHRKPTQQ